MQAKSLPLTQEQAELIIRAYTGKSFIGNGKTTEELKGCLQRAPLSENRIELLRLYREGEVLDCDVRMYLSEFGHYFPDAMKDHFYIFRKENTLTNQGIKIETNTVVRRLKRKVVKKRSSIKSIRLSSAIGRDTKKNYKAKQRGFYQRFDNLLQDYQLTM